MTEFVPIRRIENYILGPILGRGSFGHVRIATKMGEANPGYAVKYMKVDKPHSKETLLKSLLVLRLINPPIR